MHNAQLPYEQSYLCENPQITFSKSVYRRYTNFETDKEKYKFKNNCVFIDNIAKINIIKTVSLSNIGNLSKIFCVLVPKEITTLTSDIIYTNRDIKILNIFSEQTLKMYNKAAYPEFCRMIDICDKRFALLPHGNSSFVREFIDSAGFKLGYCIMTHDDKAYDGYLHIKCITALDDMEIKRFHTVGHEYMIQNHIMMTHSVKRGITYIDMHVTNTPVTYFAVICPKKVDLDVKFLYNGKMTTVDEVGSDPGTFVLESKTHNIYLCQFTMSMYALIQSYQPYGHKVLENRHDPMIKIITSTDTDIEIVYSMYNVMRYIKNIDKTKWCLSIMKDHNIRSVTDFFFSGGHLASDYNIKTPGQMTSTSIACPEYGYFDKGGDDGCPLFIDI
jgi:hypothetical protein